MGKVIIVGAGFSKALADAPLVNEFIGPIYKSVTNKDLARINNRVDLERPFLKVIDYLKNQLNMV